MNLQIDLDNRPEIGDTVIYRGWKLSIGILVHVSHGHNSIENAHIRPFDSLVKEENNFSERIRKAIPQANAYTVSGISKVFSEGKGKKHVETCNYSHINLIKITS